MKKSLFFALLAGFCVVAVASAGPKVQKKVAPKHVVTSKTIKGKISKVTKAPKGGKKGSKPGWNINTNKKS